MSAAQLVLQGGIPGAIAILLWTWRDTRKARTDHDRTVAWVSGAILLPSWTLATVFFYWLAGGFHP